MSESEVMCPKCGGLMWDNRATKKNPKAPDYKCRDKACDGVVWPPKGAKGGAPARAASAPAARDIGRMGVPELDEHAEFEDEEGARIQSGGTKADKLNGLFQLYDVCFAHALMVAKKQNITDQQAIASMAATLYIQANQRGLAA